jgi:hypothetical protein
VRPIVECVAQLDDDTSIAYFGYQNSHTFPVEIGIGSRNTFSPAPIDRGQPTTFMPGRSPAYPNPAFGVIFTTERLVWTLDGRKVTVTRNMRPCDRISVNLEVEP